MYLFATKLLHLFPPETAHDLAIKMLQLLPVKSVIADIDLSLFSQELMGLSFSHPLGLAAGFDKQAQVFHRLGQLGFSFVEIGSVTPRPQAGNPKPRLFRLPDQQAIINRYGFNSKGMDYVAQQFNEHQKICVTGINLGKNKETLDPIEDFLKGAKKLAPFADYLVVNVSSPNTPGLRDLQDPSILFALIDGIKNIIFQEPHTVPLFIKIAPDMNWDQEGELVEFLVNKIDGIIVSNTTTSREGLEKTLNAQEAGGLSGKPLMARSTAQLKRIYPITRGRCVLIGCGGISSGQDAYEKLRAGADLLQLYTAFVYQGPMIIRQVLLELKTLLEKEGVKHIREIIGYGV